jgi:hypothetical protein
MEAGCRSKGEGNMSIAKIAIDQIPGLEGAQALFGAALQSRSIDDRIVDIMVYLYEIIPPESVI